MLQLELITPFAVAIAVLLLGATHRVAVAIALGGSLISLGVTIALFFKYDGAPLSSGTWDVNAPWITALHVNFHLAVDGMSILFLLLTAILTPVSILVAASTQHDRSNVYLSMLLFLQGALVGVFMSIDLVLFYFFWEAVLIPAYFMLGIWGGERRIYAALKYVLYTMVGSLLMLVGILLLFALSSAHSFDLLDLTAPGHLLSPDVQRPVFLAFALAFGIKAAVFPFHSWVPDVYGEASPSTAIIFAGVLSKMGIYGFLRFCLPLFPDAAHYYAPLILVLAAIGIIYGALLALDQRDIKRLVACSSIPHLGFITLGIFSLRSQGIEGATLQAVNHGITIAALFALVAIITTKWGTADLDKLGGLAVKAPIVAAIFLVVSLSALGLPGLNGFAGEILILIGTFQANAADAVVGTIGVVFASAYMLRLFQGVSHGPLGPAGKTSPEPLPPGTVASWWDQLSVAEYASVLPLVALMVWIGVQPAGWLDPALSYANSVLTSLGGHP
ncbi:MAG TPA: NADH-quinone oxidoreductase subunit M [Chloroflexota bacterium]|nr:NADH-quinone oxidoreductase subunit M [Chloroflexota bacterium]